MIMYGNDVVYVILGFLVGRDVVKMCDCVGFCVVGGKCEFGCVKLC